MAANYSNWFIKARLKTRQLLLLVGLDEERNIHRTSEVLGMTQPAASKLLKDLEDMLGVQLFERLPRGMKPTWYGEIMIRHARMVLSNLSQAHDEITALKSGLTGQVNLGAIVGVSTALLPRAIARMKQQFPYVQINVQLDTSNALQPLLQQGRFDILVARLFEEHDKSGLNYELLAEEPVCLAARRGHPLAQGAGLTLRDLMSAAWVLPPSGSVLRHRFDLLFRQQNLEPPRNVIETTALSLTTALLEETDMVTALPVDVVRHYAEHGMLATLPVTLDCKMDAFGIITRRDQLLSPCATAMLRILREVSAEMYGELAVA
ncbi:LysR family transcriptional regulator [Chitinimonas naiadis]